MLNCEAECRQIARRRNIAMCELVLSVAAIEHFDADGSLPRSAPDMQGTDCAGHMVPPAKRPHSGSRGLNTPPRPPGQNAQTDFPVALSGLVRCSGFFRKGWAGIGNPSSERGGAFGVRPWAGALPKPPDRVGVCG